MRQFIAVLVFVSLMAASCGWTPPGVTSHQPDTCGNADGPTADAVRLAITVFCRVAAFAREQDREAPDCAESRGHGRLPITFSGLISGS